MNFSLVFSENFSVVGGYSHFPPAAKEDDFDFSIEGAGGMLSRET